MTSRPITNTGKRPTKAQVRNMRDKLYAINIEEACHRVIKVMGEARAAGLSVDCNVGSRYSHSIGGYVHVYRPLGNNKSIVVMKKDLIERGK